MKPHRRLGLIVLLLVAFALTTTAAYAQALVVNVSPPSGPPGTIFTVTTSGGGYEGFPIDCAVNGAYIGTFDYYGVFQNYGVPLDAVPGATFTVYCNQPTVPDSGPLAGSALFTVTAADADGDGVPDSADACPQDFGQTPNGCPDSDGDGVTDNVDSCPLEFGQTPNGCPDSDGDGVTDNADACPLEFGQTPNGCPPPTVTPPPTATLVPTATAIPPSETPPPTATETATLVPPSLTVTATPTVVTFTPTPTATIPAATLPPAPTPAPTAAATGGIRAAAVDLAQFAACADTYRQAGDLAITEVIRLSVSADPCGALTEALRRQRFGGVNLPSPLSQPRSGELRCSTDTRPVPSVDFLWLDGNYARFGSQIRLNWAGVSDAELCAAQAGDPFRLATVRGIIPLLERAEYYTGVCYGILTGTQMREAMTRLRAGADQEMATLLVSSLGSSSRGIGQLVWCGYLQRRILNIAQADIDQQTALLDRLVQCRLIQSAEVDIWRARVNEGQAGFTWNDLAAYFGSLGGRCPSSLDFLMFIANGGIFQSIQTTINLTAATAAPRTDGVALGVVHEVICNPQSLAFVVSGNVPPGCVARNGGSFVEANTTRDRDEAGIAGVEVTIYQGGCNETGGALVGTTTTNADGLFELGGLTAVPHCLSIDLDSGPNPGALGAGMWWTFAGVGGTHLWFTFTPAATTIGSIIPIPNFGWWRAQESGVTTRMGSSGEMFYSAADTIIATYDPGLWPGADTSSAELTTAVPGTIPFAVNVYRAYCEPDGWDGTLANIPAGCRIREDGRLIPDVDQQLVRGAPPNDYDEPGVPNITVGVYTGACDGGAPDYTFVTGADGIARGRLPSSPEGIAYCIYADAGLPSNAAELGVGRWVHTVYAESVSNIVINDAFRLGLTHNLLWWLTGTGVPRDDAPIPTPPSPGGSGSGGGADGGADAGRAAAPGLIPIIPVRDAAACPPGGACAPVITIGRPAAPNAVVMMPPSPPGGVTVLAPLPTLPDPQTAGVFDEAIGSGWREAVIDTVGRAVLIGQTAPDAPPNLFLLEGGGIFDIGQGESISEHGAAFSPDGRSLAFIGRDAAGAARLFVFDVETGAYRVLFADGLGAALTDDALAWDDDGRTIYFTAASADGPAIYQLAVDTPGTFPAPLLSNAAQPALTADGLLLAFVREGVIVVRFLDTGDEYPLTEVDAGTTCAAPFFDANGLDLYFICGAGAGAQLYRMGAAGLETIALGIAPLVTAGAGPVSNTLLVGDGAAVYLAAGDGTNALPFIQLPDLRVGDLRWGG